KLITYKEDYNKANIILIINNQCGLQTLLNYILYLCAQSYEVILYSGISIISTCLLNLLKHPITSWLSTTPHFIINNIGEIKTVDQCHKQLNLIFKTLLLDTDNGISENVCRILHTFAADCFSLKSTELHKSTLIEFYNKYILLFVIDQLDIKTGSTMDGKELTKYVITRARA
ncbi:unnamed protein product, partial [Adineta steineri]